MKKLAANLKQKAEAVKCKWMAELCRKSLSGITVIELVLILVRNFTPYLGCVLCG